MEKGNILYQPITVSKAYGMTSVIPSPFCFESNVDVYHNIKEQIEAFEKNGEPIQYMGYISTLNDVCELCKPKAEDFDLIANYVYVLMLEVR